MPALYSISLMQSCSYVNCTYSPQQCHDLPKNCDRKDVHIAGKSFTYQK